jgi:hypothetical protein
MLKPKPKVHPGSDSGGGISGTAFVVISSMLSGFKIGLFLVRNASRKPR